MDPLKNHKNGIINQRLTIALSNHTIDDRHSFDFDKPSIRSVKPNLDKGLISESTFIHLKDNLIPIW